MGRKPTMAELARAADVDASTVSRALADSPRVKQATKDHIREIAEKIGYEVNISASNLRKQATKTIGVVVPIDPTLGQTISDPFYLEMLGAVSAAAADRDYDLLLTVPKSDERVAEKRLLTTGKVDGLIVIGQAGRKGRLNALAQSTDRIVVWGAALEDARYTVVGSDNREGGRLAARHLLTLGRRRLLFIGDPSLPEVGLRYDGFQFALEQEGLEHQSDLLLPLGFGSSTTVRDVTRLVESGTQFDGVVAASDLLAISAMSGIQKAGLRIPEDVAVVGYDNVSQAAHAVPPLSTIDQNISLGGELMVELLLRKIRGEDVNSELTTTNLIVRESSL